MSTYVRSPKYSILKGYLHISTLCPLGNAFLLSADFFSKSTFSKNYFRNAISSVKQIVPKSVLIWVQTVCKSYQRTTQGDE